MARLGEKIANAKKYGKGTGNWSSKNIKKGSDDRCPGCQKRYKDMGAGTFTNHMKSFDAGLGCPDV